MRNKHGQATLEYIVTLAMTVFFVAFLLYQIDGPLRQWWDKVAQKIAAPCPTKACVDKNKQFQPAP